MSHRDDRQLSFALRSILLAAGKHPGGHNPRTHQADQTCNTGTHVTLDS
jgi:hypothetical protein